jgi:hypothetical protein
MSYAFLGVDFWRYVFEMFLAKRLDRSALQSVR